MIEFAGVSKAFRHGAGSKLLRGFVADMFRNRDTGYFHALRNVTFRLEDGESVAIIGKNGAGKSTMLGLIAGLAKPSEGRVAVKGRVAALLELGSGFHLELTGTENLWLNASLLGYSRRQAEAAYEQIIAFADIGDFIDEPVRTYSMGMMMRLAFSVAIHIDPDILILDEVLAVGDAGFQEKCLERIRKLKADRKSLLFVSHQNALVREACQRAIWLEHGEIRMDGPTEEVLDAYER